MARRPRLPAALVAGNLTVFILGVIWTLVLHNLQTQKGIPAAPSSSAADPPLPQPSDPPPPSPKLQAQAFRVRERKQQTKAACQSDAKRLCPKVPLAGGLIPQCLEDHTKELSDGCYTALELD